MMHRVIVRAMAAVLLAACEALTGGCAAGNTHDYASAPLSLGAAGNGRLAVAVSDRRAYVVSGAKRASFVGLSRTGIGTPTDVLTSSGRPMAAEWTDAIVRAAKLRGFDAQAVPLGSSDEAGAAIARLRSASARRCLLFTVDEWKSDTYVNTTLHFNVTLEVLDGSGALLARKTIGGKDDLSGDAVNASDRARRSVLQAFQTKISQMLGETDIVRALK